MKIYFAGSIRGGREDRAIYAAIIDLLGRYGTILTEHIGAEKLSELGEEHLEDEAIFERDISLLEECDIIVAEVSTPSLGVGYEIGRMEGRKPILCLFRAQDGKRLSAMLAGNPHLRVIRYDTPGDLETVFGEFLH